MSRGRRTAYALLVAALVACGDQERVEVAPADLPGNEACAVDGMLVAVHEGPKAQILRANGERAYYCDTKEVFAELLDPVRRRAVVGIWFQALDDASWAAHADGWSPAHGLHFVVGSRRMGAMGPTLVPYRDRARAVAFAEEHGGEVVGFAAIDAAVLKRVRRQAVEHWRSK